MKYNQGTVHNQGTVLYPTADFTVLYVPFCVILENWNPLFV